MRRTGLTVGAALVAAVVIFGTRLLVDGAEPGPGEPIPDLLRVAQEAVEQKIAGRHAGGGPNPLDEPQRAHDFFLAQRLASGDSRISYEHLRAVYDEIRMREELEDGGGPGPGGVLGWKELGPGNVGGRTRAIVVDPNDPDVMYAAGVAGGIWKSYDGGASWAPADDFMLSLAVCSLALDPTDSSVLYAGTGEGWYFSPAFVEGLGIFKSVDAGATWTQLQGTVTGVPAGAFSYVNDIVVSPNNPDRIYAGTRTGVWKSKDGGATWKVVLGNPSYVSGPFNTNGCVVGCTDLEVRSDTKPDVLFAAFGSAQDDGLFRSFDNGKTWQTYTVPPSQGRMSLALAPGDNDVLYILMADNGTGGGLGQLVDVYRSNDGGDSFTGQVNFGTLTGPWLLSNLAVATGCIQYNVYSQGWYDNVIAVDPVCPDIVWVGGVDIFRSDDGGVTWEIPGYWQFYLNNPQPPYYIHADHHRVVFHPDYDGAANQTMYVGNDGGIFKTENARAATSLEDCPTVPPVGPLPQIVWESLNNGYGVTQFYHGDSSQDGDVFVAGAQDNGTDRVRSAGTPDDWDLIFGGDGGYVAIDPRDGRVMYVEYQDFPTIQKSIDGGDTFVEATSGITDTDGIFITPFAMDQTNPDVLWTGGSRPWRTTDGAALWTLAGPDLSGPDRISAIGIAPSDGDVVYLGFTNGYVARTTDGLSPSPAWSVFTSGLQGAWVSSVAVDPTDPDVAYLTYSSYGVPHVLKSANGGQSWTSIDGLAFGGIPDIPAHWIAIRPCMPKQLFVGSELGIFASGDGGASWTPSNAGLALTVVEALDFQDDDTLVAFTFGRGAFRTKLAPCSGGHTVSGQRRASAPPLDPTK